MNIIKRFKFFIIIGGIFIGMLFSLYNRHIEIKTNLQTKVTKCESAGWTWLKQENKCLMIKEYK